MKLAIYERLQEDYYNFTPEYQDQLLDSHNIDSGLDYANYILGLEKDGTSGIEIDWEVAMYDPKILHIDKSKIYEIGRRDTKKDKKLIDFLHNIGIYYKNKYHLEVTICIYNNYITECFFDEGKKYIEFNLKDIEKLTIRGTLDCLSRCGRTDKDRVAIFALLHEIKHAIDFQYDRERITEIKSKINFQMYHTNAKYHHSIPYEKDADDFANKELPRWEYEYKRMRCADIERGI